MELKIELITVLLYAIITPSVFSAPSISTTESLVVLTSEKPKEVIVGEKDDLKEKIPKIPKIYSMNVVTNVTNRFATTLVTSKVKNLDEKPQEARFAVVLPETAYISGFVMEIDGKKYEAYVKEKEEAKQIYNNAISSGLGAAHVEANARDSNRFTVSVNIEPQSKAIFYLTYEELLKRQIGAYDIVINLHPGQPIKDLSVEVNINETRPLTFVKAPSLRSGNEIAKNDDKLDPKANIERFNQTSARVTFKPDIERQKELGSHLGSKEGTGLAGQFVVQYDVERDPQGGEILISDGYFVHFFAPSDLKPLEKHVVFVLDTSGSMSGTRIQQLKIAMKSILGQLKKEDLFNIIDFNSIVNAWNIPNEGIQYVEGDSYDYYYRDEMPQHKNETNQTLPDAFQVTEENIKHAEKVIEKLDAFGATDIKSSLIVALNLLNKTQAQRGESKQPLVIFLTDGEATVGEYGDQAINSITSANTDGVPIFSLSFGDGADRDFLEKLSLKNQGFARHIYEGADASLQLEEFYKYVSSPLLTKVNFKYVSKAVSKLTKTIFPIMFDGSEIVVAGIIDRSATKLPVLPLAGGTDAMEESADSAEEPLDPGFVQLPLLPLPKTNESGKQPANSTERQIDSSSTLKPLVQLPEKPDTTVKPSFNYTGMMIDEGGLNDPAGKQPGPQVDASSTLRPLPPLPERTDATVKPSINYTGMIIDEGGLIDPAVTCWGAHGALDLKPTVSNSIGSLEKHWAYLTLKQLLYERDAAENKTQYTKSALDIALKYSFVTPVSSLVVVKPNDTKAESNPEDASNAKPVFDSYAFASAAVPGSVQFMSSGPIALSAFAASPSYADADEADSLIEDRIFITKSGTNKLALEPILTSTSQNEPLESLKLKLPWLNDVLDQNETLDLPNGKYKLGLTANIDSHPDCPLTPTNGTGICTLLKDCPQVYTQLTDVKTFGKYFCSLTEFAGVCCPKTIPNGS